MNWLLIIIVVGLAFCILHGYKKGFIRILFSLVSIILAIAFVTLATPYICSYLENHTPLKANIEEKCLEHIQLSAKDKMGSEADSQEKTLSDAGITIPSGVFEKMVNQGVNTADYALEKTGAYQTLASSLAHFIVNGIAFFAAFVIATIALFIIARLLNLIAMLPLIRNVNHLLGVIAGFVQGMVLIWLFMYLVAVCCTSSFGVMMLDYINKSMILSYLYNHNLVLYLIMLYF